MTNRVVFLAPSNAGTFVLQEGAVVTIGRASDNSIQVPLDNISRHHLKLDNTLQVCIAEDLGSTNGTYVNGLQVTRYELRHNDVIRFGGCQIRFEQIELEQSEDLHPPQADYSDMTRQETIKVKSFKPDEGNAVPADIKTEKNLSPVAPLSLKKK